MVKKNTPKLETPEHDADIFKGLELGDDASADILISSEESIIVTLFDDETHVDGEEEDDFEVNIFGNKKNKHINPDEEDSDFDSYFFEQD